jgi:Histidine-specific methyltransferase, SAM-dependent
VRKKTRLEIIEFGLFLASLGRKQCIIVTTHEAKLPTDLNSLTYLSASETKYSLPQKVVAHFNEIFSSTDIVLMDGVSMIVDTDVVNSQIGSSLPKDWRERAMYFGTEGAKAWLGVLQEDSANPRSSSPLITQLLIKSVEKIDVRTYVSLGAGDGNTDSLLIQRMRKREPFLQYLPVDISDGLLQRSVYKLSEKVRVPLGILSDFEDRLDFIVRQINRNSSGPRLYTMLGNTFGNLDKKEYNFLSNLHSLMNVGDYFLLDVTIKGPKWGEDKDKRIEHISYQDGYRRFIANGVYRKYKNSADTTAKDFENLITFRIENKSSDVPKTSAINSYFNTKNLIGSLRRYDYVALSAFLTSTIGFKMEHAEKIIDEDFLIDDAVFLLKK